MTALRVIVRLALVAGVLGALQRTLSPPGRAYAAGASVPNA